MGPHVTSLTVCQGRRNRSNEIPWSQHQRQWKERAVFLVNRSLALFTAYV